MGGSGKARNDPHSEEKISLWGVIRESKENES